MIDFLKRISLIGIGAFFLLELAIRTLGLSGIQMKTMNVDGDRLLVPESEGYWTKGGCKEINGHFKINKQGWNSIRDYKKDSELSPDKMIAIIGDSYVEGLHVDVENSIGRRLENLVSHQYLVHEFGRAGGNIHDYIEIYDKFNLGSYKNVFIIIHEDDFAASKPNFMGNPKRSKTGSFFNKVYNNVAVFKYLNINHGISKSFKNIIGKNTKKKAGLSWKFPNTQLDFSNVCFLYESDDFQKDELDKIRYCKLQIEHELQPYSFGFDHHWNENGRQNVAQTINNFLGGQ